MFVIPGECFIVPEMLKRSKANITPLHASRCAEMGGAFGKELDRLFQLSGHLDFLLPYSRSHKADHTDDVKQFVTSLLPRNLFGYEPGRVHRGLADLDVPRLTSLREPTKLGKKLRQLTDDLDSWRDIVNL